MFVHTVSQLYVITSRLHYTESKMSFIIMCLIYNNSYRTSNI